MGSFKVVINTMVEAGKDRFFVTLYHPERPEDASIFEDGRIDVFSTHIEEHAKFERDRWEEFFSYPKPRGIRKVY